MSKSKKPVNEVVKEIKDRRLSQKVINVAVGILYDGENVGGIGVYNISKGAIKVITPEKAKDMFNAKTLSIVNVNLGYMGDKYFRKNVDFTIGYQEDYPVIREKENEKGKKVLEIENGCIIYDTNKIEDKDGKVGYKCIYINNNSCKNQNIVESQLVNAKKKGNFKCNYSVKNNKVVLTVKENNQYFELTEKENIEEGQVMSQLSGWYSVDDNGLMVKEKECPYKEFVCPSGVKMITGFEDNLNIERVDLTGATRVCVKAFKGCKNLKEVIMSDSMLSIDSKAFEGCSSLESIKIPQSVEHLGDSVYMKGTAYIYKKIGVAPFGKNVKIVMYGKAKDEKIEVALFDIKDNVVGYKINAGNINEKSAFKVEKKNVSITDEIYNYDMLKQKVLGGNTPTSQKSEIIIGKAGQGYATIDIKGSIKAQSFDELKKRKLSNGVAVGTEIVPLKDQPAWKQIEMGGANIGEVDKEGNKGVSGRMGSYLAQANDIFDALTNNQVNAISEYMSYKFYELLDGKMTFNCMSEEIKKQYPHLTWKLDREQVGGVKDSDNDDWRKCYFGHATTYHWVVFGINKENIVEKVFTFGSDCVSKFLNIDKATLESIMELESELTEEINLLNKSITNKDLMKKAVEKYKICYEIINYLRKHKKLDILGDLERHVENFDSVNIPYVEMLVKDIARKLSHGRCGLDVGCSITDFRCLPTLSEIVKNGDDVKLLYYNKSTRTKESKTKVATLLKPVEAFIINGVVGKKTDIETLKGLNEYIADVKSKLDPEEIEKAKDFIKEFNKIGLKEGKYVINNLYVVNTGMYEIYKYDSINSYNTDKLLQYTINNQSLKENKEEWELFMQAVKDGEYRETKVLADNEFNSWLFNYEIKKDINYKRVIDILEPDKISDNKSRILAYGWCRVDSDPEYLYSIAIASKGTVIFSNKDLTASSSKYTFMVKNKPNYIGEKGILEIDRIPVDDYKTKPAFVVIELDNTTQLVHNDGTQIKGRIKRYLTFKDAENGIDTPKFIAEEYKRLYLEKEARIEAEKKKKEKVQETENMKRLTEAMKKIRNEADNVVKGYTKKYKNDVAGVLLYASRDGRTNYVYADMESDKMLCINYLSFLDVLYNKGKFDYNTKTSNQMKTKDCSIINIAEGYTPAGAYIVSKGCKEIIDTIKEVKKYDDLYSKENDIVKLINGDYKALKSWISRDQYCNYYILGKDRLLRKGDTNYHNYFKLNDKEINYKNDTMEIRLVEDIMKAKSIVFDNDAEYYSTAPSKKVIDFDYDMTCKEIDKLVSKYKADLEEQERIKEEERKNNKLLGLSRQYHDNEFFKWINANNKENKTKIISKDGVITYAVNNKDMIDLTKGTVIVHDRLNYEDVGKLSGIRITTLEEEVELITENGRVWNMPKAVEKKVLSDIKEKDKKEKEQNEDVMDKVEYIKEHLEDIESWTGVKAGLYKGIIQTVSAQGKVSYKQQWHINNCYEDCIKKYPR